MKIVVFLPGLGGSKLALPSGKQIWPPSLINYVFRRVSHDGALRREDLQVTGILTHTAFIPAYRRIIKFYNRNGYVEKGDASRKLIIFDYDWRLGIGDAAIKLKQQLAALKLTSGAKLDFVGHSMGAMVADALLKLPDVEQAAWHKFVRNVVLMGMPQKGCPAFLGYNSGLTTNPYRIARGEFNKMANTPKLKTFYEVMPPSSFDYVWAKDSKSPLDVFKPECRQALNLTQLGGDTNRAYYEKFGAPPPHCDHISYHRLVGTLEKTPIGFIYGGKTLRKIFNVKSGDGLIPTNSAILPTDDYIDVPTSHRNLYAHKATKSFLRKLMFEGAV